jgi:Domain of unknown function (DUF6316)
MKRKDDSSKHARFRSNRMFEQEGQWFFRTREEDDQGPFDDELEASTQPAHAGEWPVTGSPRPVT